MTKTTGTPTPVHFPALPFLSSRYILAVSPNTATESDTSSIADLTPDETLYERLAALQDIIPAHTRRSIASKYNTATSYVKSGLALGGKTLWVVSTSALLLGVPWALAYSEEQMMVEQEKMELANQRAQNEVCVSPV